MSTDSLLRGMTLDNGFVYIPVFLFHKFVHSLVIYCLYLPCTGIALQLRERPNTLLREAVHFRWIKKMVCKDVGKSWLHIKRVTEEFSAI